MRTHQLMDCGPATGHPYFSMMFRPTGVPADDPEERRSPLSFALTHTLHSVTMSLLAVRSLPVPGGFRTRPAAAAAACAPTPPLQRQRGRSTLTRAAGASGESEVRENLGQGLDPNACARAVRVSLTMVIYTVLWTEVAFSTTVCNPCGQARDIVKEQQAGVQLNAGQPKGKKLGLKAAKKRKNLLKKVGVQCREALGTVRGELGFGLVRLVVLRSPVSPICLPSTPRGCS